MIEVNIVDNKAFPIEIELNCGIHKFTKKAAEELYQKLAAKLDKIDPL